jgi:hypothetical protein
MSLYVLPISCIVPSIILVANSIIRLSTAHLLHQGKQGVATPVASPFVERHRGEYSL